MLLKELLSEADSSDAMYQDLIDRVTKVIGKPSKQKEEHDGAHKRTYWMNDAKTGEHVGVSNVNGHIGISVVYKGPWYNAKANGGPWSASGADTKSVDTIIKKLKTAIKANIKKSTDRYGFASHNSGKPYHDSEEAKEFMQKILDRLK